MKDRGDHLLKPRQADKNFIMFILFYCLVLSLSGCAGFEDRDPGPTKTSGAQKQYRTKASPALAQDLSSSPVKTRKTGHAEEADQRHVSVEHKDKKHFLFIPVQPHTTIVPDYQDKTLRITFDPPLPHLQIPSISPGRILTSIDRTTDPQGVHSLQLAFAQDIRFLVTRPEPDTARVLYTPAGTISSVHKASQTSARPRLQTIDFQRSGQDLIIELKANGPFDYRLIPGQENQLRMLLPNVQVPPRLIKLYRLEKFEVTIRSALLNKSPEGARLILNGTSDPVPVRRDGNTMTLHIPGQTAQASSASRPKDIEYSAQNASATGRSSVQQGQTQIQLYSGMDKEYAGTPISLNLQDAEIEHVLRLLAEVGSYNLILDQNVSGTISLKLDNIPWDQALDLILQQKNLVKVAHGNILRIIPADMWEKEQQQIIQSRKTVKQAQKSEEELAPIQTEYIQINYAKAKEMQTNLQKFLSDRGDISFDQKTNQLIISDTKQTIETIRRAVRKLDRTEGQVRIEARLVYATDEFQRSIGLKWGWTGWSYEHGDTSFRFLSTGEDGYAVNLPGQGDPTFSVGIEISRLTSLDMFTLDAQLELGEIQNQVQTISSPRIVTLNNQPAEIIQGTKIPYQSESESGGTTTEFEDAMLRLSVTPQITRDNTLILDLDISDDTPTSEGDQTAIETRSMNTRLLVKNDQTMVIGGVQQLTQTDIQDRVPGLSSIPLIGWLFKNKYSQQNKRELLIFIRPHIIES
jgi:type IV pilus assembly protein PilQ